jgi:tetratricopeptide (TPR) repeat protein
MLLVSQSLAPAQDEFARTHSMCGWIPTSLLVRPVPLRTGIGTIHEEVSTSSKRAQQFYDQGLAYLQSYAWIEAARSFYQALREDPHLAMAHIGLSYAYSPIDGAAAEFEISKAQEMAKNVTDRERRRIQIRALQIRAMEDTSKIERELAVRDALDDALAAYPDDVVFLLLRGTAADPSPFADGQGCDMNGALYYQRALAIDPGNFAAHHFLTHCFENTGRIQEALPHALAYAEAAANVPHAQHMCGHVLRRAGRMDEAIARFERADELERAYFRTENIPPSLDWHYAHNLNLLGSSYQYLGEMKKAEKTFRESSAIAAYTDYDSFNRKDWPEFLLNRQRYPEALTAARLMTQKPSRLSRAVGHLLSGDALLCMNRATEAALEFERAKDIVATLPPVDVPTVEPYLEALRGALLLKSGDKSSGEQLFRRVVLRISAANGPDAWTQGLFQLEFMFVVARGDDDWELAGQLAQAMYQRAPDYAGSHYALAIIAKDGQHFETAKQEFAAAEKLWSKADPDLPELAVVRREIK